MLRRISRNKLFCKLCRMKAAKNLTRQNAS
jgi:hypothetical protein